MTKFSREEKTSAQRKEARRTGRQRQKQFRSVIFDVLVVGVLSLANYLLKEAFFKPAPPLMAGNVIDVKADMAGFETPELYIHIEGHILLSP